MNKELKKYIKYNLKKEKKKTKNFSIKEILLLPFAFILKSFSEMIKMVLYEEEFDNQEETKTKKEVNSSEHEDIPRLKEERIIVNTQNDKGKDNLKVIKMKESNIEDFIQKNNKYNDFQTILFKMIDDRNLIDSDVYNKVHIDRRLFSKIRNDKKYHPSKETIILLGLSMELSEDEIEILLDSASYSLPRNNHYDLIIRFCFIKGIYKLTDVNDLLSQYDCKLFNY